MFHNAHCNHSYPFSVNHSFDAACKHRYMETLSARIKRFRDRTGMSQAQLATRIGVSRVAVTKWESGETENLKLSNLLAICKVFSTTADDLLRGELVEQRGMKDDTPQATTPPAQEPDIALPLSPPLAALVSAAIPLPDADLRLLTQIAQRLRGTGIGPKTRRLIESGGEEAGLDGLLTTHDITHKAKT